MASSLSTGLPRGRTTSCSFASGRHDPMNIKACSTRFAIAVALAGLLSSDSGSAPIPAGPRDTAMHDAAHAAIVDHAEQVTTELAGAERSAGPTDEAAYPRVVADVEEPSTEIARAAPSPETDETALASPPRRQSATEAPGSRRSQPAGRRAPEARERIDVANLDRYFSVPCCQDRRGHDAPRDHCPTATLAPAPRG